MADIRSDLEMVLKLDETTGTTAADSSGNSNDGTLSGAGYSFANDTSAGRFGSGLAHAAAADIVTVTAFAPGDVDQTISLWVKTAADTAFYVIATRNATVGYMSIYRNAATTCQAYVGAAGKVATNAMAGFNDGTWHQVALVYHTAPTSTLTWYYDGALNKAATAAGATTWTAGQDTILYDRGAGAGTIVAAALDDVRVYSRALSASDINRLYLTSPYSENTINPGVERMMSPPMVSSLG